MNLRQLEYFVHVAELGSFSKAALSRQVRALETDLREPQLSSVLCLAVSAQKRATPLARRASRLLRELVEALPMPRLAMPIRHS